MKIKNISGIYCIINLKNNKKCIGQAINIRKRWNAHKYHLKNGTDTKYLQKSFDKYGKENFNILILEECDINLLDEKEQYYINFYNTRNPNFGYNITDGGKGNRGFKHTEETKQKISSTEKGKVVSKESKEKMSISRKGIKHSEIHNKKISSSLLGNKRNLGKIRNEEYKKELSYKYLGLKRRKNTSSKFVGVYKSKNIWRTSIKYNKKTIAIGTFKYEIEAAMAYNEIALECYGWKARLNNISEEEIKSIWELE